MPNNKDRAQWAEAAVKTYARETKLDLSDSEEYEDGVSDLLCDLMHLCRERRINWFEVYARAGRNFDTECWEESDRQRPEESTENYYPEPGEQGFRKGQGLPLRDGEPGDDGPLALPPAPPSETATNRILHRAPGGE